MSAFVAPRLRRDSLRRLAKPKLTRRVEARERRLVVSGFSRTSTRTV